MAIPSSQRKKNILWIATAVAAFIVVIVILAMLLNSSGNICVSIGPQDIQLELGQTEQLEIFSEDGDKLKCSTQWSSASPGVAAVNKDGLLTAVNAGETKVTAIVTLKGKDYIVSTDVTVIAGASDKVIVSGDKVEDDPEIKGECFTIFSTSEGVTYDMDGGTIDISDDVKQSEIFFAKSQNKPYASAWELRGSVERQSYNQSLFLSFGVKTETGKEQWFCIYEEALSRQRYWNWADSKQSPDGVHVGFNDAAWDFFHRKADNLEYILVLKDDVLKVYMGSNRYAMSLAWSLPLTEEKYGGFEKGTEYIVGVNTVDPCSIAITNISQKNGEDVEDLGGYVSSRYVDSHITGDRFRIDSASTGVSSNASKGTIATHSLVTQTELWFAASRSQKTADAWELTGTVTQEDPTLPLFMSFGVKDQSGKDQWFCILDDALSRQRYWNWWDTKYAVDGIHVFYNQPAYDFYLNLEEAPSLSYRIIVKDDVLYAYFGESADTLQLAWELPLTEELFGGFAEGTKYQLGINTVDPNNLRHEDVLVKIGDEVSTEEIGEKKFIVAEASENLRYSERIGTISYGSQDGTEIYFSADENGSYATKWELTGTITKADNYADVLVSFGVRDTNGIDQWYTIYQHGALVGLAENGTFINSDDTYLTFNQPSCSFYWEEIDNGSQSLDYKIVLENDVLYGYFGNDKYEMTLSWVFPITQTMFGGFNPGTAYQLGIYKQKSCIMQMTNVAVVAEGIVDAPENLNDKFYTAQVSSGVTVYEKAGLIKYSGTDTTELYFGADEDGRYATNWELTGTLTKADNFAELLLSFGVRDTNGKVQWYSIDGNGFSVGLPSSGTFYNEGSISRDNFVFNQAACSFYYCEGNRESDKIHYKIVIENDVLYAYFGNNTYPLTLSWTFPMTDEKFGGLTAGTAYQLGVYTQKPCVMQMTAVAASAEGLVDAPVIEEERSPLYIAGMTDGITYDENAASVSYPAMDEAEIFFAADSEGGYANKWEISGAIYKGQRFNNLMLAFGVKDENGKEQWFAIKDHGFTTDKTASGETIGDPYRIFNQAACSFYWREGNRESDKLYYKIVVKNDVLYSYFGNDTYPVELSWTLDLTEAQFGGFASGSSYQLGVATSGDSSVEIKDMTAVATTVESDGQTQAFYIASVSDGITYDENAASVSYPAMDEAEIFFAADSEGGYANKWEISGAIYKGQRFNNLMLAFGVKDENGKEQWFAIKDHGFTTDKTASGATIGDPYRAFNQAACSFYWREGNRESDKLYYKIVVKNDVLYSYFGNDTYPMELSWTLDLTEAQFGGFASGSSYQLGVATSGDSSVEIKDITAVATSTESEEQTQAFYIASVSDGIKANAVGGTLSYPGTDGTEIIFAADKNGGYANKWELTGTVTKADNYADLLLSFGVKDSTGKTQWYTIYQHGILLGLSESSTMIWDTNSSYVFNQPTCSFYWKEINEGSQSLDYKLVIEDDVLKAYFGNDQYDLTLSWTFDLTTSQFGGFTAGSAYQIGIHTQKPCTMEMTNVAVVTDGISGGEGGETPDGNQFYIESATAGLTYSEATGSITYPGLDSTELFFGADENGGYANKWELTGTVTKADNYADLLLSFGVKDSTGKTQWYTIYKHGILLGLSESSTMIWDTNSSYVFNQPTCSFYWKEINEGSQSLDYKLVIEDDVLKAYFGNDQYDLTLSWTFDLTTSQFGGFSAGSAYQIGIHTQKPCTMEMTNVTVTTEGVSLGKKEQEN